MNCDEKLLIFLLFMTNFLFVGYLNTWGIYQNYFIKELNYSILNISFISSLSIGLNCVCIFIKPLILKINYIFILYIGLLLCSFGLLYSSISLKLWCLYLTLGFIYGIGYSFINFFIFTTPYIFMKSKNKNVVIGIIISGSGFGGLTLSYLTSFLIDTFKIKWTLRIISFIFFIFSFISIYILNFKIKKINYVIDSQNNKLEDFFKIINNFNFILWIMIGLLFTCVCLLPNNYLSLTTNINKKENTILISFLSICNSIGKICISIMSNSFCNILTSILCFIILFLSCIMWFFSSSFSIVIIFSIINGFFSSVYLTLMMPITLEIINSNNITTSTIIMLTINSIGFVISFPIASYILNYSKLLILYISIIYLLCTFLMFIIWIRIKYKNPVLKKYNIPEEE